MTNAQKFVYELYEKHSDKILLYLRLCRAKRDYAENKHKGTYSFYTYKQMDNHSDLIKEVECDLILNRISLQKIQKINRYIKKLESGKDFEIESLDYITKNFISLYNKDCKRIILKEIKPDSNDMRRISEFKSIKRHRAQKSLNPRIQARIITRRLVRLYRTLNPRGNKCLEFVKCVLDEMETNPKILDLYISKAKTKNPNYRFY